MPPLTDTKLTPALYEVFLSYKRATTKVERWLAITSDGNDTKVLTITEMQRAADRIKTKGIKVPKVIYHAFDLAIRARSEVTTHFKSFFATKTADAKTSSHEFFTNTLRAVFKSLCSDQIATSTARPDSNPFELLSNLRIEDDAPNPSDDDKPEADEACHEHSEVHRDDGGNSGIKDDVVIQDLELRFALWDLETTCEKVKTYWADAAAGRLPVVLAGFLTNAAMSRVAFRFRCHQRFFEMSELIDCEEVFENYNSSTLGVSETARKSSSNATKDFTLELQVPLLAIALCQQETNHDLRQPSPPLIERPQDYIIPLERPCESTRRAYAELEVCNSLLRSIKRLPPFGAEGHHGFMMGVHPYIEELDLHSYTQTIPTAATFVIRLIVESYKSWCVLPGGKLNSTNPRLLVLKFAQDVHMNIRSFRLSKPFEPRAGCNCDDCANPGLMERLRLYENDVSIFISEKRFDLYHQSPVVAGYQVAGILAKATLLGHYFVNISQYVGVTLHLYNFLRQFNLINEETVLLELLCHTTGHTVFRGPRPTTQFFSQYAVFQGMTPAFDRKSRSFNFGYPMFHKRRISPHTLSVTTGLNGCGFGPFCRQWVSAWRGVDNRSRITNEDLHRTLKQVDAHPIVCVLEPLESVMRSEWEGRFPVARVNWFEVFTACTEVLQKISTADRGDPADLEGFRVYDNRDHSFHSGKSDVENLLQFAQKFERDEFLLECDGELEIAKDAIRETFKNRKTSEFLWNL